MLEWTRGWEWDLRRRAPFHVSRVYDRPGLLTFVHDGDLWGYGPFHHGEEVDHFIQWIENGQRFFRDRRIGGRPEVLVARFPDLDLDVGHARGHLGSVRIDELPEDESYWEDGEDPRTRPVREGDTAGRLEPDAVFDFWRHLGVERAAPARRHFTTEAVEGV